jgi:hypothetical protein
LIQERGIQSVLGDPQHVEIAVRILSRITELRAAVDRKGFGETADWEKKPHKE